MGGATCWKAVYRKRSGVRIVVQLIEATTGYHLWSSRYDRPLTDIFALQDEIAQKIVTTLKLHAHLAGARAIVHKHTATWRLTISLAWDRVLFSHHKRNNDQARQDVEKPLLWTRMYAEAYAGLGWTYRRSGSFTGVQTPRGRARVGAAHQRWPWTTPWPFAHALLGYVYMGKQQ